MELYTYDYAKHYNQNKNSAIKPYLEVRSYLKNEFPHISLNAGHDLNLDNLEYILENIAAIKEVSIGHALVCDSIDLSLIHI